MKRALTALAIGLVGLLGCNRRSGTRGDGGRIEVRWTGSERGRLAGTATAGWCAILRQLEIRTIRGDTGFAVVIHPTDSVLPGQYRVMNPVRLESLPRAAGVAVRWATPTAIRGFQGESGSVVVERSPSGQLSGRLTAAARSVTDTGRVAIEGSFRDLPIRAQKRGCDRRSADSDEAAEPDDTLLH